MFQCRESQTLNKWSVCWRGEWPEVWGSQPTRNNYEMRTRTVRSGAWHHLPPLKAGQSVLVKRRAAQQWLINDLLMHCCHMPETSVTYFIDVNLKKKSSPIAAIRDSYSSKVKTGVQTVSDFRCQMGNSIPETGHPHSDDDCIDDWVWNPLEMTAAASPRNPRSRVDLWTCENYSHQWFTVERRGEISLRPTGPSRPPQLPWGRGIPESSSAVENNIFTRQSECKSPGGPDHHFSLFGFWVQRWNTE